MRITGETLLLSKVDAQHMTTTLPGDSSSCDHGYDNPNYFSLPATSTAANNSNETSTRSYIEPASSNQTKSVILA